MNIELSEINGAKLFELDPELFDRRLGGYHNRVTEKQREEYLDSLRCVLCGRVGGSCDCGAKHPPKKRRKKRKH
jgi:hypothetical protein